MVITVAILLCYNFNKDQMNKLKILCMRVGTKLRAVSPSEYSLSIRALASGEKTAETSTAPSPFSDRMLVQCEFQDRQVNALLQGLRTMHLSEGVIKAVMTETNSGWDSISLHHELLAERDAFLKGQRAHAEQDK